jgi:transposase
MRSYGTPKQLEQRRMKAAELMKKHYSDRQIVALLNVTLSSVRRWRNAYQRAGQTALKAIAAKGRPPKLTKRQKQNLVARLLKGAMANGFGSELWTCPRIVELTKRLYGIGYHVDHIPRLMATLGFSCQKPERQARERNEADIQHWIHCDWPRIKKSSS